MHALRKTQNAHNPERQHDIVSTVVVERTFQFKLNGTQQACSQ